MPWSLLLLLRATYTYGVVLHAHPVRGESHNQRNTTGEVATVVTSMTPHCVFAGISVSFPGWCCGQEYVCLFYYLSRLFCTLVA